MNVLFFYILKVLIYERIILTYYQKEEVLYEFKEMF